MADNADEDNDGVAAAKVRQRRSKPEARSTTNTRARARRMRRLMQRTMRTREEGPEDKENDHGKNVGNARGEGEETDKSGGQGGAMGGGDARAKAKTRTRPSSRRLMSSMWTMGRGERRRGGRIGKRICGQQQRRRNDRPPPIYLGSYSALFVMCCLAPAINRDLISNKQTQTRQCDANNANERETTYTHVKDNATNNKGITNNHDTQDTNGQKDNKHTKKRKPYTTKHINKIHNISVDWQWETEHSINNIKVEEIEL